MIVSGEKPWDGGQTGRYGWWRELEPLWDGTPRWEYVAPSWNVYTSLLSSFPSMVASATKVAWLEDEFMPRLKKSIERNAEILERLGE